MEMCSFSASKTLLPSSASGKSRKAKILSLAFIPFIPIWKKLPKRRMGKKNSAANRIMIKTPEILMLPSEKC